MRTFVRHQLGALAATVADFSTMIVLVSLVGLSPAIGTAVGAAAGGITNFMLGRNWIFQGEPDHPGKQALRYAIVSAVSLLLNSAAEHLLATVLHVEYVVARVIVAVTVSICWNFPMQRSFVFRATARTPARSP